MRFLLIFVSFITAGAALALSPIEKAQWKAIDGEFIVKFKNDASTQSLKDFGLKKVDVLHKASNVQLMNIASLQRVKSKLPISAESSDKGVSAELIRALEKLPGIEYVEPNYIYELYDSQVVPTQVSKEEAALQQSGLIPNDEFFTNLWGMNFIQGPEAWTTAIDGAARDVVVAIFDTGITADHPDLAQNIWQAQTIDGEVIHGLNTFDYGQPPLDEHGHGTHVAGTIGAVGDNEVGVAGVSWNVKLLSIKIFEGAGARFIGIAGVVKALDWSTELGVDLSSHSWGGGAYAQSLFDSISRANDAGIPFVAAAGNGYSDNDQSPQYPASYELDNIVSVAAVDSEGNKPGFSNWGIETVDIAAPGVDVFSTHLNGGYTQMSGTSMATPHVSGALALLLAQDYWMYGDQAKDQLLRTAVANEKMTEYIGDEGATLNLYTLIHDVSR